MLSQELVLRPAVPADVSVLFALICHLAEYEQLSHEVTGCEADLADHLFGVRPYAEAILAEVTGQAVGFALFFHNYSTFLTRPGIYLEDLFVLPNYRQQGVGTALLSYLAQLALDRGCGRLDWTVLDWNQLAIEFYQNIGAKILPDWRVCRVTGDSLAKLANMATSPDR